MFVQCSPRAKIVPPKVRRQTKYMRTVFSFRRAGFEHRVVNAYVFAPRIKLAKSFCKFTGAVSGRDLFENRSGIRQVLSQCIGKRVGAPQKHSAVPKEIARIKKLLCPRQIRLLSKTSHPQRTVSISSAGLNIAVAGFRASGTDAEHDDVISGRGNLNPRGKRGAISIS